MRRQNWTHSWIQIAVFACITVLGLSSFAKENPPVSVQIKSEKSAISPLEIFYIDLDLKNESGEVSALNSIYCQFQRQWVTDNPNIVFNRGTLGLAKNCPEAPKERFVHVPKGQHFTDKMDLYITKDFKEPILAFRLALKTTKALRWFGVTKSNSALKKMRNLKSKSQPARKSELLNRQKPYPLKLRSQT